MIEKCIEVEFRVPGNYKAELEEHNIVVPRSGVYVIDTYFEFDLQTGNLHRVRRVQDTMREVAYSQMRKFQEGRHVREESSALDEIRYQQILQESRPIGTVSGYRRKVPYQGITICLDTIERLGDFMELEMLVRDPDQIPAAEERLYQLARLLEIDTKKLTTTTYPQMMIQNGCWNYDTQTGRLVAHG